MKIDGRFIASQIKANLTKKIKFLRQKNIIPHLAVILIGNDSSSEIYVRQKMKVGEELGIKVTVYNLVEEYSKEPNNWLKEKLINLVNKLNSDNSVHGVIIQRPVPIDISKEELNLLITAGKDVDGFHPKSPFTPPIVLAVVKILEWVYKDTSAKKHPRGVPQAQHHPGSEGSNRSQIPGVAKRVLEGESWEKWLKNKRILIIGRGETAGKPIAETLKKFNNKITIAHSQTTDLKGICLASDVIITCVGRPNIVRLPMLKANTILIGVGLHQQNGKLRTDYDEDEIAEKVAFYTPVPGGVGPVNVACLFENLVISCGTVGGFS